jgi:hypothetical protein
LKLCSGWRFTKPVDLTDNKPIVMELVDGSPLVITSVLRERVRADLL